MSRAIAAVAGAVGLVAGLGLGACKARREAPGDERAGASGAAPALRDAAPADANLDACRAAAARAPGVEPARRAQALLDACQPCGDWQALLSWNTPAAEGGPSRAAIEQAMLACRAYCEPNARQRFLGALDAARGQGTRGPWRALGEVCKAEVSAVPDARFMGAPYFALDRIARALGPAADPALLAAIELPLPALSVSGVGVELPAAPGAAEAGPRALTVDAAQVLLGRLPVATLSPTGLRVSGDYPGAPVALERLAAALAATPPAADGRPVALLAPHSLAAARIAEVVAAAAARGPAGAQGSPELRLAVGTPGPGGWVIPGTIPIALTARRSSPAPGGRGRPGPGAPAAPPGLRLALGATAEPAIAAARAASPADLARGALQITVEPAATADGLAALLGALAALEVKAVTLAAAPAAPGPAVPPRRR